MEKRTFLKSLVGIGLLSKSFFESLEEILLPLDGIPADELASDEDFWKKIRAGYKLNHAHINLENGYYCKMPEELMNAAARRMSDVNYEASFYIRRKAEEDRQMMTQLLADAMGCTVEELIITRNTTESLDTIISGYPWESGDEAVLAHQDYGAMINMFRQVSHRHGIKLNFVDVPLHPSSDEAIVKIYEQAITPRTRLLMVCHMINITGHILPVRKIVDMAHSKGVEVMVDGAHTFAHIQFDIPSLGCDYFGTSLHKWLSAPLGLGALFVRKEKTEKLWPLFGQNDHPRTDIRHLNHIGTYPFHSVLTIQDALAYYFRLGPDKKEERLRYLQRYWTERARNYEYVHVNTPIDIDRACGIGNFGITGIDPGDLSRRLLDKYGIWTVAINNAGVKGVRITPNIFTLREDLDKLVAAIEDMAP